MVTKRTPASTSRRASRVATVLVAKLGRLGLDVERFSRLLRADHRVRTLIERVDRLERIGFFLLSEVIVHCVENPPTLTKAAIGHTARQFEILHSEAIVGRVAAEAERRERRTQVAGAREFVWHAGNANVLRQIVARRELVRHDAPHAGKRESRAGLVAREHVVRAALVRCFAVRHRTAQRDFVRDLCGLRETLVEDDAVDVRSN
jgi:hypothetical protein